MGGIPSLSVSAAVGCRSRIPLTAQRRIHQCDMTDPSMGHGKRQQHPSSHHTVLRMHRARQLSFNLRPMDENSRHNRVLEHGNFFVAIRGLGLNGMRRLSKKYASFPQKTFTRLPCPSVHLLTQPPFPPGARGGKRGRKMFLFVPYFHPMSCIMSHIPYFTHLACQPACLLRFQLPRCPSRGVRVGGALYKIPMSSLKRSHPTPAAKRTHSILRVRVLFSYR